MEYQKVINRLKLLANPKNVEGMARFGIVGKNVLGVSIVELRKIAKEIGKNHELALKLWDSEIHEAMILASMVDVSELVTEKQVEKWVREFESWDICDQVLNNLFKKTKFAWGKATEWSKREKVFEKRAGFVIMAVLAVYDKKRNDKDFEKFLPLIKKASIDERNFIKKAVNWALRQIGKRSKYLNKKAIIAAKEIQKLDSKFAKWVANDALRELTSEPIKRRL